ncbi:MAG: RsmE family RNA methyltransferase [Myxococcota bacterium]
MTLRVVVLGLRAGEMTLTPDADRYVTRVHRLGVGARVDGFDPDAEVEAEGTLVGIRPARVRFARPQRTARRPDVETRLIQAVGKGTKLDTVVRAATELGVTHIVLAVAARSVKRGAAAARYERIAREAARQCGRGDVPHLVAEVPLAEAWAHGEGQCILLDARGPSVGATLAHGRAVTFAVGPEGGWTDDEREAARAAGYTPARLGPFTMRTETVAAAALGARWATFRE